MFSVKRLMAFLSANTIGFLSPMICFYLASITKLHAFAGPRIDAEQFQSWFLNGVMMTWIICAVFSLGYFFAPGKTRVVFLLVPVLVPIIYGLSVLAGFLPSL